MASGRSLTAPAAPTDAYGAAVYSDDPDLFWRLGETTGTTVQDSSPERQSRRLCRNVVLLGQPGAISGTSNTAARFNGGGTNTSFAVAKNSVTNPTAFSLEAWLKTTTVLGGKIIGSATCAAGSRRRPIGMSICRTMASSSSASILAVPRSR